LNVGDFSCFSKTYIDLDKEIHEFIIVDKRRKNITFSFVFKACLEIINQFILDIKPPKLEEFSL